MTRMIELEFLDYLIKQVHFKINYVDFSKQFAFKCLINIKKA